MAHPFCLDKVKNVAKKLKIRVITFGSSEDTILSPHLLPGHHSP
jgi:hypothetical protein